MNKRDFMRVGAGALAVGASWPGLALGRAGTGGASGSPTFDNTLQAWQSRVGQTFGARAPTRLVLERVDVQRGCAATTQFTLVFAAREGSATPGSQLLMAKDGRRYPLYLDSAGSTSNGQELLRADFAHLA